jgi:putative ABC transport system permease protein
MDLYGMAFIVLLCAGLNYTNLSIARSIRRSREVGIRKTVGAQRSHVVNQFLVESLMIAIMALVLGLGLFLLIKPHFLSLESSLQELLVLDLSPRLVLMFVLFAVIIGISAGIFPALFFSRINAVQVLKNFSAIPVLKGVTMRKALIVFQYSVSIIAITTTLIMHKQYRHFIAFDLGFTTENILNIRLQGNKPELLKKELHALPEVMGVSQSLMITSVGTFYGTLMKNPNEPQDSAGVSYNVIDEHYLPLHDHQLLAGENFKGRAGKTPESEVIVNEQVLKRFNIGEQKPEKAIGEVVTIDGQDLTIIGVMKDFQYGRANNQPGTKVVMRYAPEEAQYLNVKILSSDWPSTYAKIESMWKEIDKVHPLDARFYDEQIEAGFQGLKASMKVGSFIAFLVIAIASIGLLGMVVYSTETRIREVSIRKVFGASDLRLLYLLSRGFLMLVMVAASISLPVTYLFFDRILFPEMANHAPLGLFEMSAGVVAVIAIALLMIGSQTAKVVRTNPAEVLKVQ